MILTDVPATITQIDATWILVGKILAVLTVVVGLFKAVEYLWAKTPTAKIETRLETAEKRLRDGDKKFDEIDARLKGVEDRVNETQLQIKNVNEGITRIGRSQISLLRHMIDGNGIDKMREEADDLTDFFIKR